MKIEKQLLHSLISNWMRHDAKLHAGLRPIQIRLLYERIVEEQNYLEIAQRHGGPIVLIREIIRATFLKLRKTHGGELAGLLEQINQHLEEVEMGVKKRHTPLKTICLN